MIDNILSLPLSNAPLILTSCNSSYSFTVLIFASRLVARCFALLKIFANRLSSSFPSWKTVGLFVSLVPEIRAGVYLHCSYNRWNALRAHYCHLYRLYCWTFIAALFPVWSLSLLATTAHLPVLEPDVIHFTTKLLSFTRFKVLLFSMFFIIPDRLFHAPFSCTALQ